MRVLAIAVAMLLFATGAVDADDRDACNAEVQDIDACTRLIESGGLSKDLLAATYVHRGNAFSGDGAYDRAIADYDSAIRLQPDGQAAYLMRYDAYLAKGDFDAAVAWCDQILRWEPDNADAHLLRAWALYSKGDSSEALPSAEMALRLDDSWGHSDVLARVLLSLGRRDEGYAQFVRAMEDGSPNYVRDLQADLKRLGYDPGPVDGRAGAQTRAALRACIDTGCRLTD